MKFVLFYHSVLSDWNHGNAHFLRGIATEWIGRGHRLYELTHDRARAIGQAADQRVLSEHTYTHRAEQLEGVLTVTGRN